MTTETFNNLKNEVTSYEDIVRLHKEGVFTAEYVPVSRYRENHVFDEDKSVKWNKEEAIRQNEANEVTVKEYHKKKDFLYNEMKELFIKVTMSDYNLTHEQARLIYERAWRDGHSEGVSNVAYHLEELADLFVTVMEAK